MTQKANVSIIAPMTAIVMLTAGCPKPDMDSGPQPSDTGEPVECDTGYVADRGECVPEACGTGDWGDLETTGSTVFVNVAASEGGDGSEQGPFRTIQEGLDAVAARETHHLVVAAGTYVENLTRAYPVDSGTPRRVASLHAHHSSTP